VVGKWGQIRKKPGGEGPSKGERLYSAVTGQLKKGGFRSCRKRSTQQQNEGNVEPYGAVVMAQFTIDLGGESQDNPEEKRIIPVGGGGVRVPAGTKTPIVSRGTTGNEKKNRHPLRLGRSCGSHSESSLTTKNLGCPVKIRLRKRGVS